MKGDTPATKLVYQALRRLAGEAAYEGTIKQLAAEAGVSVNTASRALAHLVNTKRVRRSHFNTHPAPLWRVCA